MNQEAQKRSKDRRKKNDFIKVSTDTSGLRPGLVRETKPEYMRILEEQKKNEASKAQTNEKKDADKINIKENLQKETTIVQDKKKEDVSKQIAEIKDGSMNMESKVLEEVKATSAESVNNVIQTWMLVMIKTKRQTIISRFQRITV
ncbi:hypothetical protein [Acetivibrio straminisolvens]|uniref:Translation initiation factor 2 n=1 Tax=Acetivibrio straminisolvens JCM 21531 TaxID=1294263 RepID=W4V2U0_9FIRM|nr:hypothetical protein [Acetivibrio straminisolvens]GAE87516.1 translation initiation factor 2 [Acetivibrio straminisolvens JCM 21531]